MPFPCGSYLHHAFKDNRIRNSEGRHGKLGEELSLQKPRAKCRCAECCNGAKSGHRRCHSCCISTVHGHGQVDTGRRGVMLDHTAACLNLHPRWLQDIRHSGSKGSPEVSGVILLLQKGRGERKISGPTQAHHTPRLAAKASVTQVRRSEYKLGVIKIVSRPGCDTYLRGEKTNMQRHIDHKNFTHILSHSHPSTVFNVLRSRSHGMRRNEDLAVHGREMRDVFLSQTIMAVVQ